MQPSLTSQKKVMSNKLGYVVVNDVPDQMDEFAEGSSSRSSSSGTDGGHGDTGKLKYRLIADGI